MSSKKIKILPLENNVSNTKTTHFNSVSPLLFYLESLRGEIMISGNDTSFKNRFSNILDDFKNRIIGIENSEFKLENLLEIQEETTRFIPGFIGNNRNIRSILEESALWAKTPYPVLITGETGTGKEMFARLIHQISNKKTFLPVNCGAIPSNLIESELFGYVKGAFTGAGGSRLGKFEEADGGTIFLDEIAELDDYIQVKLLRVIQFGEIQRLGSDKVKKVNTRIIAATNKNIEEEIRKGRLREDLYYRLSSFEIKLPPLRDRKDDIPALLTHFMQKSSSELNRNIPQLSSRLKNFLYKEYDYPGNIRELENLARQLIVFGEERFISKGIMESRSEEHNLLNEKVKVFTFEKIKSSLEENRGSVRNVSRDLGLSESRVYQICKKFNIRPADYQGNSNE
ncbi:MAG: sigma-54-dependent Fis family transcriptional regulator [Candidatus Delongbacteria bacterium]|nr:sigma-54-dependent Fis family transcriptional regulator [Candidatus Delongbacteria bacterium]MBN2835537.1 sigma-54-dependent Fis family transcriptional regulator [Candidatus Delongbacteria bacterium]